MIFLLEYIDLFQSEWQHEANIWEELPCPLSFYIAIVHLSIATVANYEHFEHFARICSYYASILLFCFCFPIIPEILPAKSTHP